MVVGGGKSILGSCFNIHFRFKFDFKFDFDFKVESVSPARFAG